MESIAAVVNMMGSQGTPAALCAALALCLSGIFIVRPLVGEETLYPHNAVACEHCHSVPTKFGSGLMAVQRRGVSLHGKFIADAEGGIHHRVGESTHGSDPGVPIIGERAALNLLGDGYIEAIQSHDIEQIVRQQSQLSLGVAGVAVRTPVLEKSLSSSEIGIGRFGWKRRVAQALDLLDPPTEGVPRSFAFFAKGRERRARPMGGCPSVTPPQNRMPHPSQFTGGPRCTLPTCWMGHGHVPLKVRPTVVKSTFVGIRYHRK